MPPPIPFFFLKKKIVSLKQQTMKKPRMYNKPPVPVQKSKKNKSKIITIYKKKIPSTRKKKILSPIPSSIPSSIPSPIPSSIPPPIPSSIIRPVKSPSPIRLSWKYDDDNKNINEKREKLAYKNTRPDDPYNIYYGGKSKKGPE